MFVFQHDLAYMFLNPRTDFVEEHPGGEDLILDHVGQDGITPCRSIP